jgi:hypothetical protein
MISEDILSEKCRLGMDYVLDIFEITDVLNVGSKKFVVEKLIKKKKEMKQLLRRIVYVTLRSVQNVCNQPE